MQDKVKRLTLEMSLKPFKKITDQYIKETVEELFQLWRYMIKKCETVNILLWVADGSEILSWTGDEGDSMEWAKYVGFANIDNCDFVDPKKTEFLGAKDYIADPPDITYGDLKRIIKIIKETAMEMYGVNAEVGATFDPGPEFAYSDFKYKSHPEINKVELADGYIPLKADYEVICPWAKLHADNEKYATYPGGIPEGTHFGTFFGKQAEDFMETMGFDYIWFSNGFSYSFVPWTYHGANFDGEKFGTGDYRAIADRIISFWEEFKNQCPRRIEVRGTNFSTGMEISKDCTPVQEFYDREFLDLPACNSPWGYLNYDFGLELGGYLTRIACTPTRDFPFRFYLDDPWFWQICWEHGFERQPHEIYGPMSLSRVAEDGSIEGANILEILTVDGERGVFDEQNTLEAIPHLRTAFERTPDKPGLLTLLYPFSEYHDFMEKDTKYSKNIFFNDWIICNTINNGLPLNTVVNTDIFKKLHKDEMFKDTILFVPTTPLNDDYYQFLQEFVADGGQVLFYGPVKNNCLRDMLNISSARELTGEFELETFIDGDQLNKGEQASKIKHKSLVSAGGITEVLKELEDKDTRVCATVKQDGQKRVYALSRKCESWRGGTVAWVRGTLPFDTEGMSKLPERYSDKYADGSLLTRWMLQEFGITFLQKKNDENVKSGFTLVSRNDNAYFFSGYKFDSTVESQYQFPQGAPLMVASSAKIKNNQASYIFEKAFHYEARIFVKQEKYSVVTCRQSANMEPTANKLKTRSLEISGLKDAILTVYPPLDAIEKGLVEAKLINDNANGFLNLNYDSGDKYILIKDVTGALEISW